MQGIAAFCALCGDYGLKVECVPAYDSSGRFGQICSTCDADARLIGARIREYRERLSRSAYRDRAGSG